MPRTVPKMPAHAGLSVQAAASNRERQPRKRMVRFIEKGSPKYDRLHGMAGRLNGTKATYDDGSDRVGAAASFWVDLIQLS